MKRAAFCLLVVVACRRAPPSPRVDPPDPAATVPATATQLISADAHAQLAPLGGEWIERWALPSGATAFVTRPQGATEARPVVVAVHGAEDHADWACSEWRATVAGFAWVICPQGVPLRSGYAWNSAEMIAKRAFEARDILVARYGPYVSRGPLLYGGFSQGATLASSVVAAHPGEFDRVIMVEAGHTPLSATGVIYGLKRGGVETAAISCSTGGCATFSKDLVAAARDASFELLTSDGGRRGHVFDGVTMESVGQTIVQMVAADARFSGLPPALREVR